MVTLAVNLFHIRNEITWIDYDPMPSFTITVRYAFRFNQESGSELCDLVVLGAQSTEVAQKATVPELSFSVQLNAEDMCISPELLIGNNHFLRTDCVNQGQCKYVRLIGGV